LKGKQTMKNEEIKISRIYAMKVGRNTIGIRIMRQDPDGRWIGINVKTNKEVVIQSADRLCGLYDSKADTSAQVGTKADNAANDAAQAKEPKQGGLGGAVRVLEEAAEPMSCPEIVKQMLEKGYWKTDGKTPAATIYSAILREIKEKGQTSRFRKAQRGKFELTR
jgi:hypothetical protein